VLGTVVRIKPEEQTVPVRILLVDDDERFAALVQAALEDDGYDVIGAVHTAADAAPAVIDLRPDVVVLDLVLPDGDGMSIADEVRAKGSAVPVVLFSSLFNRQATADALGAGYGYVEKAAGVDGLEAAIDAAVALSGLAD
jgi:two-component system OmpR family response regulator